VQENPIEYEGRILSSSVIRDIKDRKEAQKALNFEREKRLSSFIDGQEGERERLSRELHDGLGQALIAMKMQLESIKPDDVEKTKDKVARVKTFVISTIEDVRRMSNNLMPAVLSNFGLVDAISHLTKLIKSSTTIEINFDHNNVSKDISSKISTYLYRIIQEALNNAVKHSGASEINVMLIQEDNKLRLVIEDNGKGFDQNKLRAAGNGLYNMRERVNLLHGTIDITPSPGAGVVINIKIPLIIKADE
jgi:signal transduction histidine kinase